MCRSVPQMDATLTLTSTSVRPNPGTFTSRTSAPGAACGLTTASIVVGIKETSLRKKGASTAILSPQPPQSKRTIVAPGTTPMTERSLLVLGQSFLGCLGRFGVELFRFAAGDAQCFPVAGTDVLSQEYDLSDVIGV